MQIVWPFSLCFVFKFSISFGVHLKSTWFEPTLTLMHQICGVFHCKTLRPFSARIYSKCHGFPIWAYKTCKIAKVMQLFTFFLVNLTSLSMKKVNVKHGDRIKMNCWVKLGFIWLIWFRIVLIFTYASLLSCTSIFPHPPTILAWFLFQTSKNTIFWWTAAVEATWRLCLQDIKCFCKKKKLHCTVGLYLLWSLHVSFFTSELQFHNYYWHNAFPNKFP